MSDDAPRIDLEPVFAIPARAGRCIGVKPFRDMVIVACEFEVFVVRPTDDDWIVEQLRAEGLVVP